MTTTSQSSNVHFFAYDRRLPAIWETRYNTIMINSNTSGYVQQGMMTQLSHKYPAVVEQYVALCKAGKVKLGRVVVIRPELSAYGIDPRLVQFFFCPIKAESKDKPRLDAVISCLKDVVRIAKSWNCNGIATAALGCGSNPDFYLSWEKVGDAMLEQFSLLPIPVNVIMGKGDAVPGAKALTPTLPELTFTKEAWEEAMREVRTATSTQQMVDILMRQASVRKLTSTEMLADAVARLSKAEFANQ